MAELSEEEVNQVDSAIRKYGVFLPELRENLLDHCCCLIEEHRQTGEPFEQAFKRIMNLFGEDGLRNIQDETTFLITHKHRETMKKVMYASGLLAVISLVTGSVFKLQHWPGANMLILSGFAFLGLFFVPLWTVFRFREASGANQKVVHIMTLITALLLIVPGLAKLMHWPYANMLMGVGFGVFFLLFLPLYFIIGFRNPVTRQHTISQSILLSCCGAMMILLTLQQPSHKYQEQQKQKTEIKNE